LVTHKETTNLHLTLGVKEMKNARCAFYIVLALFCSCSRQPPPNSTVVHPEAGILLPQMGFTQAERALAQHGAKPQILQIMYPDPKDNKRTEVYKLRDGRVIDLSLTRNDTNSPWVVNELSEVIWTNPEHSRDKKWIPLTSVELTDI
jgi:hypothetical protein